MIKSIETMVEHINNVLYSDSLITVPVEQLRRAIVQDLSAASSLKLMTEDEVEMFICSEVNEPERLKLELKFPSLNKLLNDQF